MLACTGRLVLWMLSLFLSVTAASAGVFARSRPFLFLSSTSSVSVPGFSAQVPKRVSRKSFVPSAVSGKRNFLSIACAVSSPSTASDTERQMAIEKISVPAAEKLRVLREEMQREGLGGYIVQTADAHQSEYIADCDMRRAFLSGFDGSAGTAAVTLNDARQWTDGRYFLQAEQQLDPSCWKLMKAGLPETPSVEAWLKEQLHASGASAGGAVGYDPFTTSFSDLRRLEDACGTALRLVPVGSNLVDRVWNKLAKRPETPKSPVFAHSPSLAGSGVAEKLTLMREKMKKENAAALVVSALDEVAYVCNARGADIEFNPVFFGYLLVTQDSACLYVNAARVESVCAEQLKAAGVSLKPYEKVVEDVGALSDQLQDSQGGKIWMDPATTNVAVCRAAAVGAKGLAGAAGAAFSAGTCQGQAGATSPVLLTHSPVSMMKAVKNQAELDGMRRAHERDGAALVKFFSWVEGKKRDGSLWAESEISLSDKVEECRREVAGWEGKDVFVSLSFPSISSVGPNGAVIHYRPERDSCLPVTPVMYLLDSGAQYRDGTTDVTRTVHLGDPTPEERRAWTLVLKGHIALAAAAFPEGTKGPQLDAFARQFLWQNGLDYRHGTGHGVGAFLNVHEGPLGISPRLMGRPAETALVPGMIVSNEPGFYRDGGFGVRLENLVAVKELRAADKGLGMPRFLGFEDLTMCPFMLESVAEPSLLTDGEIEWLNMYHQRVKERVGGILRKAHEAGVADNSQALEWLDHHTKPIAKKKCVTGRTD
uniref:Peptidase M24 domain-containing protein n=1 Tax=Chromera velia CCMP2878 TaxID=1169474 RepID=A0A0G4FXN9_9ALVE|mmetsp:Transcript_34964/g.69011  ORF Transcript_34964/g.69011 Transcript_34964/m.69011 type:complete len:766 (+) Transcript_34964:109-2406(+)|eukprot:Cvel_3852.t1-p1 / transcript=Cvel_3852.t1 / gene=Cvel_3852 / organism=Chromera_velia_CCMP2878 / gene_product=Probable Xaa-Pro aminopeptidase P, putative / transcript_product=Probable Xaa-Pro aminopeptidase P, putative / location=Cvel_scaffold163:31521-36849(-) / protein_length=765 / sequence_SO=supercontig / SO=protein_coding / is_pseudo=false